MFTNGECNDVTLFDASEQALHDDVEELVDRCVYQVNLHRMVHATNVDTNDDLPERVTPTAWDYNSLHSRFAWLPKNIIMQTFEMTTQYAWLPYNTILKKHFKSPNPTLNVMHWNKPIATDTISLDTPTIDGGETYAQIFIGTKMLITDVYAMKSLAQFPGMLSDNITEHGTPTKLISDHAQVEISKKVQEILHTLYIGSWQSKPHHQHQNPAERHYQDVKQMVNTVLNHMGTPAYCWLLCLYYVCFVLNNSYSNSLKGTPLWHCTGVTNDITPCSASIFMSLSTSIWMTPPFHLRVRNFVVIGLVLVRMSVIS